MGQTSPINLDSFEKKRKKNKALFLAGKGGGWFPPLFAYLPLNLLLVFLKTKNKKSLFWEILFCSLSGISDLLRTIDLVQEN